jgi:hypothetical protein
MGLPAPPDDSLQAQLLRRLAHPAFAARLGAGGAAGRATAGCLVGLLGFEDGDRDDRAARCGAELVQQGLVVELEPILEGGLLVALAACCLRPAHAAAAEKAVGCALVLPPLRHVGAGDPKGLHEQLFAAQPGRSLIYVPAARQADARLFASDLGVPLWPLGRSGGRELVLRATDDDASFREVVRLPLLALLAEVTRASTAPA